MDIGFWNDPNTGSWRWHGRAPHRRGIRRMRRGLLKLALLKLLAELPRHGYDLIRAVREKGWSGGPGSVYPLLGALEAAGLASGRDEGDRRIYEVTERGRQMLGEHAAELERLLNEDDDAEDPGTAMAARLRESAGKLMRAVSQLDPSSKPETVERACELLNVARKEIYELLAQE